MTTWLDTVILGFDGQPKMFTVLNASMPGGQHERKLTNGQWVQMSEFDFILPSHRHHGHDTDGIGQHTHLVGANRTDSAEIA